MVLLIGHVEWFYDIFWNYYLFQSQIKTQIRLQWDVIDNLWRKLSTIPDSPWLCHSWFLLIQWAWEFYCTNCKTWDISLFFHSPTWSTIWWRKDTPGYLVFWQRGHLNDLYFPWTNSYQPLFIQNSTQPNSIQRRLEAKKEKKTPNKKVT